MIALIVQAKMVNVDGMAIVAKTQRHLGDAKIMMARNGTNQYKNVKIAINCV